MSDKRLHLCVIGAHIGDAEITAGGVICKYTQAGHKATIVHLTPGEKGNPRLAPEEYREIKIQEATKSAKIMGADVRVLDFKDGELPNNDVAKYKVCDVIREIKPDIVITHWKGSFHKDHIACHHVAMEGVFYAAVPGIKRPLPAHPIRLMYFAENWEDPFDYQPDVWLDISPVFEQWKEAINEHGLFRGEVASFDYWRYYEGLVNMRGAEVGVSQAQTFMVPPISRKYLFQEFPIDQQMLIF
jgi:LmbE family N-acetylglucosaminyl deacetylase